MSTQRETAVRPGSPRRELPPLSDAGEYAAAL